MALGNLRKCCREVKPVFLKIKWKKRWGLKARVFLDVRQSRLVNQYRRYEGSWCLHISVQAAHEHSSWTAWLEDEGNTSLRNVVTIYQSTQPDIQQDLSLHHHSCANLRSRSFHSYWIAYRSDVTEDLISGLVFAPLSFSSSNSCLVARQLSAYPFILRRANSVHCCFVG
jgi:hypothetical protein